MHNFLENNFDTIANNFINLKRNIPVINDIVNVCTKSLQNGNKIMFCGNGGSASDSQHLAAELVGRYKINRKAYNSIALTTDTSILTAVGNDFGYDTIFERQVEGIGQKGDVLFGISTSGNSKNIILAFKKAKEMGITTVAMTGETPSKMGEIADFLINVPSATTNNIQEMHIAVGHSICELIEQNIELKSKALFLDRDGVINVDKHYTYKIEDFEFVDGIIDVCKQAQKEGYKIIIISNQSGVERGYFTMEQMNNFNNHIKEQLRLQGVEVTDIFCCPLLNSNDRKPNSGMFEKARAKYNIDMSKSVSIGDSERDIIAAENAGVGRNYFISESKNLKSLLELV